MEPGKKIDQCLSTRDGHLFIEECDTVKIAREFGSPVFVISESQLRGNICRFKQGFAKGWRSGPVKIMPAAKASWSSAVQRIIADEGCGCDVYSPGEFSAALNAGFDPEYISVNGVPKPEEHIKNAIIQGARVTIDGIEEVDIIERWATELEKPTKVRLRLRPAISGFTKYSEFNPTGPISTDIAALVYKGGFTVDQAIEVGHRILKMKHVALVGFHQHHGRHNRSLRYWKEQMKAFARDIGVVCEGLGGYQPGEIDIGGGFACPRDPFGAENHYSEPFQLLALHAISQGLRVLGSGLRYKILSYIIDKAILYIPNQVLAPTIEEYAEVCTATLCRELPLNGIDPNGLTLQAEPGRSVHGDTAIHLTTVESVKRMTSPIKWNHVIVDTTEFWFTGGRYEHHLHDYIFANKTDSKFEDKADIIGRSCYGDRLLPAVKIPAETEPGDIIAMLDVGSYQEVSMSNFNAMPRPATLLVNGDNISVIRKAETLSDVFRRDVVPDHLRRLDSERAGVDLRRAIV